MTMFDYFKRTKLLFSSVIALIIINAALSTLAGISSANVLTSVTKLNSKQFIFWISIMALAYIMYAIIGYAIVLTRSNLRQNIDALIREDLANKISKTSYKNFHKQTTATYTSWMTNDINTINDFGIDDFLMIVQQVSEIVLGGITLAYFHFSLLITVGLLTIVMAIVPNLFSKWMSDRSLELTHANERLVNTINDVLNGFNTLFLSNRARVIIDKINNGSADVKEKTVSYSKSWGVTQAVTNGLAFISQVIILAQSGWLILNGLTPVGTISGSHYFAGTIFAELSGISFNWQEFKTVKPILQKINDVVLSEENFDNYENNNSEPINISLKDLSYHYENKDINVLNNISYIFENGKKYALLGDSGVGKTTLLKILGGSIRNYSGEIISNNKNYKQISDFELHQKISYIQQDPYIFSETLYWNLTLGTKISPEKLNKTINDFGLKELIDKLPNGLDEQIDSQGSNLSGGQKQRISLAREWLRDTSVYLLDEATSSLDRESSLIIERNIMTDSNKTIIFVTHHLYPETKELLDGTLNL